MSISFSGIGSGLPIDDWINALIAAERPSVDKLYTKQSQIQTSKTVLNTVEGKFSSLRSYIETITDSNVASSFDLFSKRSASSSDTSIATATASNGAAVQNISLKITNLATATKAYSTDTISDTVTSATKVSELGNNSGTEGVFSIFVNGVKHEFEVEDENTTLGDVAQQINDAAIGLTAGVDAEGKFFIQYDNATVTDFRMGSNGDTSNFLNVTQLTTAVGVESGDPVQTTYSSINPLSGIKTSGTIVGASATANLKETVTAGTFTIGKAQFTIDENTSLDGLIAEINSDTDAGVTVQYDLRSNKLVMTSKTAGNTAINLEDATNAPTENTSNFLTAMGLVGADGNSLACQQATMGTNAVVEINGTTITAATNSLTGDITGFNGVTINLLKETEEDETTTISVNQDTSSLTSAMSNFISKFNDIVNEITKDTASTGSLKNEYSLLSLKSSIRQTVTGAVNGLSTYDSLAMIGISTGSVGTSISTSTSNLNFDQAKFLDALSKNPNEVRALLVGDSSRGITGILQQLESKVESALDIENGYFASRESSMERMITDLNKSIEKGEKRLEDERKRLVQQFSYMDNMISQLQSQSSALFG